MSAQEVDRSEQRSDLRRLAEQAAKAATLKLVAGVILSEVGLLIAVVFFAVLVAFGAIMFAADEQARADCSTPPQGGGTFTTCEPSREALSDIPPEYLEAYRAAGEEYELNWTLIAAVGKQESDHGRAEPGCETGTPTPYGTARGPMQFLPSTWATVGVDGNGDGEKDPCDYQDAIPAAAGYLVHLGAREDPHGALCSYYGACGDSSADYADEVLAQADRYCGGPAEKQSGGSSGGSAGDSSPTSSPEPSSGGSGDPPQGWSLVDEDRHIDYEVDSKYASYFKDAVRDWNLGGVVIQPSPSPAETDLVVKDGELDGAMAKTTAGGELIYDVSIMDGSTDNAKDAASDHELGHALGFEHTEKESVMRTPIITNGEHNFTEPTDYDKLLYYETWGGEDSGDGSGGSSSDGSGGSGGGEQGDAKAVFPLPEKYEDSYDDTWGASRAGRGGTHEGTDIMAPEGTPIYSITDGKVVRSAGSTSEGWDELGGWVTMIEASESVGPIHKGDMLYYAHQSKSSSLKPGDTVSAGDQIGIVGDTGEGPVGTSGKFPPHLHLGWYDPTGERAEAPSGAMNPYPLLEWLRQNGGEASGGSPPPAGCEGGSSGGGNSGDGTASGSATGEQVVKEAKKYLGTPYVLGGPEDCIPYRQMDCTCLTTTVFRKFGYDGADALPDDPGALVDYGEPVEQGDVQAGDIYVYADPGDGTGGHVAIAVGDGSIIHANMATMDVAITPCPECAGKIIAIRRLVD